MRKFKLPESIELALQLAVIAAFLSFGIFYFTEIYPRERHRRTRRDLEIQVCTGSKLATSGGNAETAKKRCEAIIH